MFLLIVGLLAYDLLLLFMTLCFHWLKGPSINPKNVSGLKATILVPFRNEEDNLPTIIEALSKQSHKQFEVIFINDHSTDSSSKIIEEVLANAQLYAQSIDLVGSQGKKAAIARGIEAAEYDVIITTDADCSMKSDWLSSMLKPFENESTQMVLGGVMLEAKSLWEQIQSVEFTPLIGITALAARLGNPMMANGANLAYRKNAFAQVGGFEGIDSTPSGDDELLMNKIQKSFKRAVVFNSSARALVTTQALKNWNDFVNQRLRWASKWKVGKRTATMVTAITVFLIQLTQLFGLISIFQFQDLNFWWFWALSLKLISEFLFIHSIRSSYHFKTPIMAFFLCFILYPFYAIYFGLAANFKKFEWKGRKYPSTVG